MGFESLTDYLIEVHEIEIIQINNKNFTHTNTYYITNKNISNSTEDFLLELLDRH